MKILILVLTAAGHFSALFSQSVQFSGQLRPRAEVNKKSLAAPAEEPLFYTYLRSRLSALASPSEKVQVLLELQDSRHFGSAPAANGTGDAKNVDLHQAWARAGVGSLQLTLGRQVLALGSQRFLSSLEWHNVGRSFDGVSALWKRGAAALTGIALVTRDSSTAKMGDGSALAGLHYANAVWPLAKFEVHAFHDRSSIDGARLYYPGLRVNGDAAAFFYDLEFIYQTGTWRDSLDARGFYAASLAGVKISGYSLALGADLMSGDDTPTDKIHATYRAAYFFTHAYFGWMDYFTANPAEGVIDVRLESLWRLPGSFGAVALNVHHFLRQAPLPASDKAYGSEADVEWRTNPWPKTVLTLGLGGFFPPANSTAAPEAGYFAYVMPGFNF